MKLKPCHVRRLLEFFLVGVVMGVSEDLLAIAFATNAEITPRVFWVALGVALPFAVFSELLVDYKDIFRTRESTGVK